MRKCCIHIAISVFFIFTFMTNVCLADINDELIDAVRNKDLGEIKYLLDAGADPNSTWSDGYTVLNDAEETDSIETVKMLLDYGAEINRQDRDGFTILMRAAADGKVEMLKFLIEVGGDVNAISGVDGSTALHYAVSSDNPEVAKNLIDAGADVNAKDSDGFTVLMSAADSGNLDAVKMLLNAGADANARNSFYARGATALEIAKSRGYQEIVKILEDSTNIETTEQNYHPSNSDSRLSKTDIVVLTAMCIITVALVLVIVVLFRMVSKQKKDSLK